MYLGWGGWIFQSTKASKAGVGGKKVFPEELRTAGPRPVCLPHFQPFPRPALQPRGQCLQAVVPWFLYELASICVLQQGAAFTETWGRGQEEEGRIFLFSSASTACLVVAVSPVWMHLLPDSLWAPGTTPAPLCLWPQGGDSFLLLLICGWLSILSWSLSYSVTYITNSPALNSLHRKYLKCFRFSWQAPDRR